MAIVSELGRLIEQDGFPYRRICREAGLSRSSLSRWLKRHDAGEEVWQSPGPRKAKRPDIGRLYDEIIELARLNGVSHGQKRMPGSGALYLEHKDEVSRRGLAELVESVRREIENESLILMTRIEWQCPGLVWAMDEVEWRDELVLTIRDLGSKYRLHSLVGRKLTGVDIARWLEALIEKHGAPLVIKRDNGSRLKCAEVDKVLGRWCIIPLDSPVRYPEYNGSVEQAQGEFRRRMDAELPGTYADREVKLAVRLTDHELNHLERRSLENRTACEIFRLGQDAKKAYPLRKRVEVYGRIREIAAQVMVGLEVTGTRGSVRQRAATAWRKATQRWLQNNGLITVTECGNVLPLSPFKMSQN